MDPFILFYIWAAMIGAALVMALYLDHRMRRRVRSGALPVGVFLLSWGQSWAGLFILFSPTFHRIQEGRTRWMIWPLRLITFAHVGFFIAMAYVLWRGPAA